MIKWVLCFGGHIIWLFLFLYMFNFSGSHNVDMDTLSVSISVLQTVLAVVGLVGIALVTIFVDKIARETAENRVIKDLPSLLRRELAKQDSTENVLGDEPENGSSVQSAVNSLDGGKK